MEVNLNINATARIGAAEAGLTRPAPSGQQREDDLLLSNSQSLLRAAIAGADVRPEKVERAREAISGSKYPPTEIIDQISRLLAIDAANR